MVQLKVLKVCFVSLVIIVLCNILIFSAQSEVNAHYKVHYRNETNTSEHLMCINSMLSLYGGIHSSKKKCIEEVKSDHDLKVNYKCKFDNNITYADDISKWQLFIHQGGKYKILFRSLAFPDSRKFLRDTPCIRLLVLSTENVPGHIWKELE